MRGVGAPSALGSAVFFGAMQFTYASLRELGFSPLAAGALSGVPEALLRGPVEAFKNLRQAGEICGGASAAARARRARSRPPRPRGALAADARSKGTAAMGCREIPGNAIYFSVFDAARRLQSADGVAAPPARARPRASRGPSPCTRSTRRACSS